MKIAGIVVYEPEYERLIENIQSVHSQVDYVVIYLNSDIDKDLLSEFHNIHYLNDGNNNGIATALNSIMACADSLGAKWCLLLDQDSVVERDCIKRFEHFCDIKQAAILTPTIHDDKDIEGTDNSNGSYSCVDMCITSGSYNNVKVWRELHGFLDAFFIDYVDWEYCARVRKCGYHIYRINDMTINHRLGTKTYHCFLGRKVFTYNHSAFRKYYITRNTIVSYKLYPNEPKLAHPYLRTMKRVLFTILFEDDKTRKVQSIIRGMVDSRELYRELRGKQGHGN